MKKNYAWAYGYIHAVHDDGNCTGGQCRKNTKGTVRN